MALSTKQARALEQVKMGLNTLYGSDYFTEDEWIKLDVLIHKGEYVFTNGPEQLLKVDPSTDLIDFEDAISPVSNSDMPTSTNPSSVEGSSPPSTSDNGITAGQEYKKEPIEDSKPFQQADMPDTPTAQAEEAERLFEISSSESSEQALDETPKESPQELVEDPAMEVVAEPVEDAVEEPVEETLEDVLSTRELVKKPSNGGLAYYTQDQLDEIKQFNSGLTKAGEKKKPKYKKTPESEPSCDPYPEDDWQTQHDAPAWEEQQTQNDVPAWDDKPASTVDDWIDPAESSVGSTRIEAWASGVGSQVTESGWGAVPTPTGPPRGPAKDLLVQEFIKVHGRRPHSDNELYQPNNPQFKPLTSRSASRAPSIKPSKSSSVARATKPSRPSDAVAEVKHNFTTFKFEYSPGLMLYAQSSAKRHGIQIEIQAGDKIELIKPVSGCMHVGRNHSKKVQGQFSEAIFRKPPAALIEHQRQQDVQKLASTYHVDRVEQFNANQWDEVPTRHAKAKAVAPPSVKPARSGLASSRYAVLAEKEEVSEALMTKDTKDAIDRLLSEKLDQLLQQRTSVYPVSISPAVAAEQPAQTRSGKPEALKPCPPKTATCWFWATPGKDCRFTAEECRDVHAHTLTVPGAEPPNLRMGKPTWGSLSDAVADSTPSPYSAQDSGFGAIGQPASDPRPNRHTCWFWANGKCTKTEDKCEYAHYQSSKGVAHRPQFTSQGFAKFKSWNRFESKPQSQQDDVANQNGGWGETTSNAWDQPAAAPSAWETGNSWKAPTTNAWDAPDGSSATWKSTSQSWDNSAGKDEGEVSIEIVPKDDTTSFAGW